MKEVKVVSGISRLGVILALVGMVSFCVAEARADVTIKELRTWSEKRTVQRTTSIKGSKMRIEEVYEQDIFVTIYDLDSDQLILTDQLQRKAEVRDLLKESANARKKVPDEVIRKSIKPTGKALEVDGRRCDEYASDLAARFSLKADEHRYRHEVGTVCVATATAELKEVTAFGELAEKKGVVFQPDDRCAVSGRLNTLLLQYVTGLGGLVLKRNDVNLTQGGIGFGVSPGDTVGGVKQHMIASEINTDPIADEVFEIPKGWLTIAAEFAVRDQEFSLVPGLPETDPSPAVGEEELPRMGCKPWKITDAVRKKLVQSAGRQLGI